MVLSLAWALVAGFGLSGAPNPPNPVQVGSWPGYARTTAMFPGPALAVAGDYAYVGGQNQHFEVYDIADLAHPRLVAWCGTDDIIQRMALAGHYAYVTAGIKLEVIDVQDPLHPARVADLKSGNGPYGVAVSGSYAYVTDRYDGLRGVNIQNPTKPQPAGTSMRGQHLWGIALFSHYAYVVAGDWGNRALLVIDVGEPLETQTPAKVARAFPDLDTISTSGGYLYSLGANRGVQLFDLGDPAMPRLVGTAPTVSHGDSIAVSGPHAFIPGSFAMQVVDISNPAKPQPVARPGDPKDWSNFAHGIQVRDQYAFVTASGLLVFNISNPGSPQIIGAAKVGESQRVAVSGHYAYVADKSAGLQIIDVADSRNPRAVSQFIPSSSAGASPVGYVGDVVVQGRYAYLACSSKGLQIVDVSDPARPKLVGRVTDLWANGVAVSGGYAYVAADLFLAVVDIRDPANPQWISATVESANLPRYVAVSGKYAYVLNNFGNLGIVDISDSLNPKGVTEYNPHYADLGEWSPIPNEYQPLGIAFSGNYAFVAYGQRGLNIVDISDPTHPKSVANYAGAGYPIPQVKDVMVQGNYAYLVNQGLEVLDISNPVSPIRVAGCWTGIRGPTSQAGALGGHTAYLASGSDGLLVFDLNPLRFLPLTKLDTKGAHVFVSGPTNQSAKLQTSRDLKTWQDWQAVTLSGAVDEYIDSGATAQSNRFYRLVAP